jgi:hypothetical protein
MDLIQMFVEKRFRICHRAPQKKSPDKETMNHQEAYLDQMGLAID